MSKINDDDNDDDDDDDDDADDDDDISCRLAGESCSPVPRCDLCIA